MKLPWPVLPLDRREEAAQQLGVSLGDLDELIACRLTWRDGKLRSLEEYWDAYPDEHDAPYGASVLPADLLVYEIEVPRDPRQSLTMPISSLDVWATDMLRRIDRLKRLAELSAPEIILINERLDLQRTYERRPEQTDFETAFWKPSSECVRDWSNGPVVKAPQPGWSYYQPYEPPATVPLGCAVLPFGFLVQFPFASIVLGRGGEVRDVFSTSMLAFIGADERHILLNARGPAMFVRDATQGRWLTGAVPNTLPRFVAAGAGEENEPFVYDSAKDTCWPLFHPRFSTDPHRYPTPINSTCGRYVWDGVRFVFDPADGRALFDGSALDCDSDRAESYRSVLNFAKTDSGWRFLLDDEDSNLVEGDIDEPWLKVVDENGSTANNAIDLEWTKAVALSPDGTQLLHVTEERLTVLELAREQVTIELDLKPLQPAIALPEDSDLWRALGACFVTPAALAKASLAEVRQAAQQLLYPEATDDDLEAAIARAAKCPPLPATVPGL